MEFRFILSSVTLCDFIYVIFQQEVHEAHYQYTVVIVVGGYVIAQDEDFFERVVDALEGGQFLLTFLFIRHGKGGLGIISMLSLMFPISIPKNCH